MTRTILAALAVAAFAAPALADTTADFAIRHFAQTENGDGARLQLRSDSLAGSADVTAFAIQHFAMNGMGNGERLLLNGTDRGMSASADEAIWILDNDSRGFN